MVANAKALVGSSKDKGQFDGVGCAEPSVVGRRLVGNDEMVGRISDMFIPLIKNS